ncbi:hypothetical protein GN956_G19564 [Arapaima gigas]
MQSPPVLLLFWTVQVMAERFGVDVKQACDVQEVSADGGEEPSGAAARRRSGSLVTAGPFPMFPFKFYPRVLLPHASPSPCRSTAAGSSARVQLCPESRVSAAWGPAAAPAPFQHRPSQRSSLTL